MSVESLKSLFDIAAVALLFMTFLAGAGALITGRIVNTRQSNQLKQFDSDMTKAKADLAVQQERAAKAEFAIALAEQHAAEAKFQLARITGPPHRITPKAGIAKPDLSESNKQVVVLTEDTLIELPTFPRDEHFDWTLSILQDGKGGHRFRFSPDIGQFNPNVDVSPNTGWLVNLQTDSDGTRSTGMGGTRIDAPKIK